jgi:hypothetical protein
VQRDESAPQPVPRQGTGSERLAADEGFAHASSVPRRTDSDAERDVRAINRPKNRPEFTLGEKSRRHTLGEKSRRPA